MSFPALLLLLKRPGVLLFRTVDGVVGGCDDGGLDVALIVDDEDVDDDLDLLGVEERNLFTTLSILT